MKAQFDSLSKAYSQMARADPIKTYAQRPFAVKYLGKVSGKLILDVGCGNGIISRMLARAGAKVVGYDIARNQIAAAKKEEEKDPLGIKYFVSTPRQFTFSQKFDGALAVMVLHYSKDVAEYYSFFRSAFSLLKPNGKFFILTVNPAKIQVGKSTYGRFYKSLKNGWLETEFSIPRTKPFAATSFVLEEKKLIGLAKQAGFKSISKKALRPTKEGEQTLGAEYWREFKKSNEWVWLICKK